MTNMYQIVSNDKKPLCFILIYQASNDSGTACKGRASIISLFLFVSNYNFTLLQFRERRLKIVDKEGARDSKL